MATFHFNSHFSEWDVLLNAATRSGDYQIVIEKYHDAKDIPTFKSVQSLVVVAPFRPVVCLVGDFTTHGIAVKPSASVEYAGKYYVDSNELGPLIRFIGAAEYVHEGKIRFGSGTIELPRGFYDRINNRPLKVPDKAKQAYATIVKSVKRHLQKICLPQPLWVTQAVLDSMHLNDAEICVNGRWCTIYDIKPPSPKPS